MLRRCQSHFDWREFTVWPFQWTEAPLSIECEGRNGSAVETFNMEWRSHLCSQSARPFDEFWVTFILVNEAVSFSVRSLSDYQVFEMNRENPFIFKYSNCSDCANRSFLNSHYTIHLAYPGYKRHLNFYWASIFKAIFVVIQRMWWHCWIFNLAFILQTSRWFEQMNRIGRAQQTNSNW